MNGFVFLAIVIAALLAYCLFVVFMVERGGPAIAWLCWQVIGRPIAWATRSWRQKRFARRIAEYWCEARAFSNDTCVLYRDREVGAMWYQMDPPAVYMDWLPDTLWDEKFLGMLRAELRKYKLQLVFVFPVNDDF